MQQCGLAHQHLVNHHMAAVTVCRTTEQQICSTQGQSTSLTVMADDVLTFDSQNSNVRFNFSLPVSHADLMKGQSDSVVPVPEA